MASVTPEDVAVLPVPPRLDEDAHHLAWEDWARRAPGQKLTTEKEGYALIIAAEVVRSVEKGHFKPENSRKAYEVMVLTAHRESDLNPRAKNHKSSATGVFQQIERFHERSPLNPPSVRKVPLTVEQRMDVATAAGFFLRQLAHSHNWHKMKIHDAAYEVQKFHRKDMHRYADPEITREVVCLSGALFPGQASMIDNAVYSDEERVKLRCPNSSRSSCKVGGCDDDTPAASDWVPCEERGVPRLHIPMDVPPIDQTPKDSMPKDARDKWDRAIQTGSTGVVTAIMGMGGGAVLGAATSGGVTVVPSGTALALSFNLLHPAGQVGALIGLGVVDAVGL
ncbi:hypothetical protein Y699_06107 [Aspergillus fumigatus Z5]|nr:hypothetical protein Y699_06107 [Aspergillus fumigatus Z5]